MTSEPSRWAFSPLPAPDVPLAATMTMSSGSSRPGCEPGGEGQRAGRRVAAGHGDPGGPPKAVAHRAAGEGQLGQAVGPAAGVVGAVEPGPRLRVGRAGSRRRSRRRRSRGELRGDLGRRAVGQREEDDVVAGERVGRRGGEDAVGHRRQVRVDLTEPLARGRVRRDGAERQRRGGRAAAARSRRRHTRSPRRPLL